ncbi:hypothetical protein BDV10DRAFT_175285 [Aspergillus recurvatus]
MPFLQKKSPLPSAGPTPDLVSAPATESKLSLRPLFNRRTRATAVAEPQPAVRDHSRQAHTPTPTPAPGSDREQQKQEPNSYSSAHPTTLTSTSTSSSTSPSPSTLEPRPPRESQSQAQTQTTWEDIDPPTPLLSLAADHSVSLTSIASRYHEPTHIQPTIPSTSTTMPASPTLSTPSLLPSYSDVSGAVVLDAHGSPRFLTPQEEQERKDALAQAVHERMMGLPRRTDFSWEASATPVLPRYEDAAFAEKLEER